MLEYTALIVRNYETVMNTFMLAYYAGQPLIWRMYYHQLWFCWYKTMHKIMR